MLQLMFLSSFFFSVAQTFGVNLSTLCKKGTFSTPVDVISPKKSISAFEKMVSQSLKMKKKEDYTQMF